MACSINITSVTGTPTSGTTSNITVSGTIIGCTSSIVNFQVSCGPATFSGTGTINQALQIFSGTLSAGCACGSNITLTVSCGNDPTCTAVFNGVLTCYCCPTNIVLTHANPLCNSQNKRLVTFTVSGTVPANCLSSLQIDFGDGNLSSVNTVSGNFSYSVTHPYTTGSSYNAILNVITPTGCPIASQNIVGPLPPCPPCNQNAILSLLCTILQPIFLFELAVAIVLLVVGLYGGSTCIPIQPQLIQIAIAFFATAALAFLFLFIFCNQCVCQLLTKLIGQTFFIVGVSLIMFLVPPNCSAFPPLLLIVLILILIAAGVYILYSTWFSNFKNFCPLKICDFWAVIANSAAIAAAVMIMVFVLLPIGISPLGLITGFSSAIGIISFANIQITIETNNGNC